MSKLIIFEDKEFEDIIRAKVGIYDRPLNADDVKNIKSLTVNGKDFSGKQKVSSIKGIEYLVGLEILTVTDIELPGGLEYIKTLNKLLALNLRNTKLTDLKGIEHFPDLEECYVSGNNIASAEELAKAKKLKEFDLSENPITNIDFCKELPGLKRVLISGCKVNSLEALENCAQLEYLVAKGCGITEIGQIKNAIGLRHLELQGNNIKSLYGLEKASGLEHLDVSNNPELTNISSIEGNKNLLSLNLSRNKNIEDLSPIGRLTNIQILYLSDCGLTSLDFLGGTKTIETLHVDGNGISNVLELDRIMEKNPIKSLNYRNTGIERSLKEQAVEIESEEVRKKVAYYGRSINENDLRYETTFSITAGDVSRDLIRFRNLKELTFEFTEGFNFNYDTFRNLTQVKTLKDVSVDKRNLDINTAREILSLGLPFNIKVQYRSKDSLYDYTLSEYVEIEKSINSLIKSIPEGLTELEKAVFVYHKLGSFITYDRYGNKSSYPEEMRNSPEVEDMVTKTRNLYGPLVEGKAVCVGYANALSEIFGRIGIECKNVSGNVPNVENSGHQWNVAKINGKWYYFDLTWDARDIKEYKRWSYFGLSERSIRQDHTIGSSNKKLNSLVDMRETDLLRARTKLKLIRPKVRQRGVMKVTERTRLSMLINIDAIRVVHDKNLIEINELDKVN